MPTDPIRKVCSKCYFVAEVTEPAAFETFFYPYPPSIDGFGDVCRECLGKERRQREAKKREADRIAQAIRDKRMKPSSKTCTRCMKTYTVNRKSQLGTYFHRCRTGLDGLRAECKECRSTVEFQRRIELAKKMVKPVFNVPSAITYHKKLWNEILMRDQDNPLRAVEIEAFFEHRVPELFLIIQEHEAEVARRGTVWPK
jgi:hypothetical protein